MDEDRRDGPGGAAGETEDSHAKHRWVTTRYIASASLSRFVSCVCRGRFHFLSLFCCLLGPIQEDTVHVLSEIQILARLHFIVLFDGLVLDQIKGVRP